MANEEEDDDVAMPKDPQKERRSGERVTSVYRPALIETEELAGFCLVRNLSPGGMMGSVYAEFAENQPVSIQFHPDCVVPGKVAWCRDGRIGIEFSERVDVGEVLRMLSERIAGARINRSPRLQLECEGEVEFEGKSFPIRLRDISQRGIKAEIARVRPGDEVIVRLEGLEPRKAVVRWAQDGLAGMNFVRLIPFEQLATWVIARQSG